MTMGEHPGAPREGFLPDIGKIEDKLDSRFGELKGLLEAMLEELRNIRGEITALQQ